MSNSNDNEKVCALVDPKLNVKPVGLVVSEDSQAKEGLRDNKSKIDLTQLSPLSQILESIVFMYGACKYFRDNWKKFKAKESDASLEFIQCAKRHLLKYEQGEFNDQESKLPHIIHAVWNLNRLLDLHYYGLAHMKNGKDLYHQPFRYELPKIPTLETFEKIYGYPPPALGKKREQ